MEVRQIWEISNDIAKQELGEEAVLAEDFSNIVDFGNTLLDAMGVENYLRELNDRIGRVIFVNRPYYQSLPSVLRDSWEFGSIVQKIQGDLVDASENESWELEDGVSYDNQVFYKSEASAKFFNSKVTLEIHRSFTDRQVRSAFTSADQLNAFISMLYNEVDKSLTVRLDGLVMRTIDTVIASVLDHEIPDADYGAKTTLRAVNLLKEFKTDTGDNTTTAATCLYNPDFIRYAIKRQSIDADRLKKINTLYNESGKARFTPPEYRKTILLNDFAKSAGVYLYDGAGQFNTDNIQLLPHETVPFWQGSGTDYSFDSISSINITLKNGHTINASGILGITFDRDAIAVCNEDRRITSAYNAKAEFTNMFWKVDVSLLADLEEQVVIYFVADAN